MHGFLTPTEEQFVALGKIAVITAVVAHQPRQYRVVLPRKLIQQFCFGCGKFSGSQIMQILQNEERSLIGKGQSLLRSFPCRVNVSVADFMVEIIQAQFHEIAEIITGIYRHQFTKNTEIILCTVKEITNLQRIPVCKISFAANKTAGFIKISH